jgi:hypothetical protein
VCSPFHFIEQEAFEMSEKIRNETIYKFVNVEVSESSSLGSQPGKVDSNSCNQHSESWAGYIKKVILEDDKGNLYLIEPSMDGLRFAKGEITYQEYRKHQRRETLNIVSIFFMAVGLIGFVMFAVKNFFI